MKLTKKRAEAIRKVIDENRLIADRARILDKRGYTVIRCPLKMGRGRVGTVLEYAKTCRLQIGSPTGYMRYAWVVVFDPLPWREIWKFNKNYYGELL